MAGRQLAAEGFLLNRLAQARGALQVGGHGGFEFFDHAQAPLDFGDDARLFGERWKGNCYVLQHVEIDVFLRGCRRELREPFFRSADEELRIARRRGIAIANEADDAVREARWEFENSGLCNVCGYRDAKCPLRPQVCSFSDFWTKC